VVSIPEKYVKVKSFCGNPSVDLDIFHKIGYHIVIDSMLNLQDKPSH
jgi:hypothetical protein